MFNVDTDHGRVYSHIYIYKGQSVSDILQMSKSKLQIIHIPGRERERRRRVGERDERESCEESYYEKCSLTCMLAYERKPSCCLCICSERKSCKTKQGDGVKNIFNLLFCSVHIILRLFLLLRLDRERE